MSDIAAGPFAGRVPVAPGHRRWWLRWPVGRKLVLLRRLLRNYRLHRDSHFLLTRADERLLYDIGLEPLDLIEAVRNARLNRSKVDLLHRNQRIMRKSGHRYFADDDATANK